jgi:Uri superfamily endonuclease
MRGTYALIILVPFDAEISVGALGRRSFPAGYYVYVGSAMGGLAERVGRHLRREKRIRWHIDYLLTRARVIDVIVAEGRGECRIAKRLAERLRPVEGFGSSDCGCTSHLFYGRDLPEVISATAGAFREIGLKPVGVRPHGEPG